MSISDYRPDTPCIGLCRMDEAVGLCSGCLRTIAEITHWWQFSRPEKREVYALIELRREQVGAAASRHSESS